MHDLQPLCVLIVEDSSFDIFLLRTTLGKILSPQSKVLQAERLQYAFTALNENSVDLILTDLNLPDSEGLDTVKTLVQRAPGVPVIVLSGQSDSAVAEQVSRAGAAGHLPKDDLTPAALTRAIKLATRPDKI
jgi:DNA-binding NarL/FixJ family response regulator